VVSAVATDTSRASRSAEPRANRSEARLFEPGGVTLEDVVLGAWEELVAEGVAECPVCGGRVSMLAGCGDCGSELS
jgi:hypothetical protein